MPISDQGLRTVTHYLKKPVPKTTQRCSTCKTKTRRQRNCSSPTSASPRPKTLHRFLVRSTENSKSIQNSNSPRNLIKKKTKQNTKPQNNKNQQCQRLSSFLSQTLPGKLSVLPSPLTATSKPLCLPNPAGFPACRRRPHPRPARSPLRTPRRWASRCQHLPFPALPRPFPPG